MKNFIEKLDKKDKEITEKIQRIKSSMLMDYAVAIPGHLFQVHFFPIFIVLYSLTIPSCEQELKRYIAKRKMGDSIDHEKLFEIESALEYQPLFAGLNYLIQVLALLLVTSFLKSYFQRKRPENPPDAAPNARRINLRDREKNCSFPSGDAAQSALLCMHIMINYPATFYLAGGVVGVG